MLLEKFREFDKNGNGYISKSEFQNSIIAEYKKKNNSVEFTKPMINGQEFPSGEIIPNDVFNAQNERFEQFDKTKNPNNEGLDFKEFSAMYINEAYEKLTGSKLPSKDDTTEAPSPQKENLNFDQ